MNMKLCTRLGLVSGGAVGTLLSLLNPLVCCAGGGPYTPTIAQLSADGLVVSIIASALSAAFACLVLGRIVGLVLLLALVIGVVVGVLLGPIAYHIPNPGLALVLCGFLGAIIGWLICLLICRAGPKFAGDVR
jgi:hypothetical protein